MKINYILILILGFTPGLIFAIGNFSPTPNELQLLPNYCGPRAEKWGNNSSDPRVRPWRGTFGEDWIHMHHYCSGLLEIIRGDLAANEPRMQKMHYERAVGEFNYVQNNAGTNFVLLPELFMKKGTAFERLHDDVNAEQLYRASVQDHPDYPVSYLRLIDLLIKNKRYADAEKIITLGVDKFGEKKAFMRRASELKKNMK